MQIYANDMQHNHKTMDINISPYTRFTHIQCHISQYNHTFLIHSYNDKTKRNPLSNSQENAKCDAEIY